MQTVIILHNILRWGVLIFGVWTVVNAISGLINKRKYANCDDKSNLLFMIFCDLQLLLGLILFFSNAWFDKMKSGMGAVMKNSVDRFFTIEHGLMMVIAWVLVHVGRASVKRAPENAKHKKMLLFFGLALLLILVSIPWPFRMPEIARPYFRWF